MSKNTNLSFLTDYITADITNGRIGINNASPTVAFDVVGATKITGVLTLTSTISNGTYAYTLPSATGTLALTSALSGYLPLTGGTLTGALGGTSATFSGDVIVGSGGGLSKLTVGNGAGYTGVVLNNASSVYSWLLGSQYNINNAFEITPSTAVGGSTFTTPVFKILNTGAATFTQTGGSFSITSDGQFISKQNLDVATAGGRFTGQSARGTMGIIQIDQVTTGADGGRITFSVSPSGSTTASEAMRITSGGNVLIGGTSTLGAGGTNLEISGGRAQLVVNSTTATASWFTVYPAGDGNTYILRNTGYSYLFGTATNQATAGFVQQMSISSNGSIGAPSGTNIYNASDIRLKKNISTTTYGLNTISALNPVKFNWVDGFETSEDGKDMLGFVAQEVQDIIPEAVESFGESSITIGDTIIDNPLRVNEKFIIPVLVKAIQELKSENTSLVNRIEALENK